LKDVENFEKAMKLRNSGLGYIRVARLLNLNKWLVKGWLYDGRKPVFLTRRND